jgi:hypothetical protein
MPYTIRASTDEKHAPFAISVGHFVRCDARLKHAAVLRALTARLAGFFSTSLEKYRVAMPLILQLLLKFFTIFGCPIKSTDGIQKHDTTTLGTSEFRLDLSLRSTNCTGSTGNVERHIFNGIRNRSVVTEKLQKTNTI